ncbi:MAG: hypothetical protein K1X75_02780 [Leptospirales bacterium]|nr:hypothetical protein [Leptospirales bacterium]
MEHFRELSVIIIGLVFGALAAGWSLMILLRHRRTPRPQRRAQRPLLWVAVIAGLIALASLSKAGGDLRKWIAASASESPGQRRLP